MAAETVRRTSRYAGACVRPQSYSDKSVMETVKDFFSDVVPQAVSGYSSPPRAEDKERILWIQFQQADINDLSSNPDLDPTNVPLILVIGYSSGIQLWSITNSGEAHELMSHHHGPVTCLRLLPTPDIEPSKTDTFRLKRPLIAICDGPSASGGCSVRVVSLRSGDEVHSIPFKFLPVLSIECNKRVMVVTFTEKLAVFEITDFRQLFWVTSCYPSTGIIPNPVSLGSRWLAYAEKGLMSQQQSYGGMSGDGTQSYAATVISAAKTLTKGLSMFGESVVNSVTGGKPSSPKRAERVSVSDESSQPGIVTVIDTQNVHSDHASLLADNSEGIIAHFHAHANEPVAAMAFDPSGMLLVTVCKLGHNFHVFHLMAHPLKSSLGAVHHLYTLHRGDTAAKVIDITFTLDSRWVAVSTHRGTTHVFPISTYGGAASVRTHGQARVVNRASRFHKSAGLEDMDYAGRSSPVLSSSPGSTAYHEAYPSLIRHNAMNNNMGNPRLPPYPHSTLVYPLAQIKQPLLGNARVNLSGSGAAGGGTSTSPGGSVCVCACFATPRGRVGSSPNLCLDSTDKKCLDSLYVVSQSGLLIEYVLEPRAKPASSSDKITDHSGLELLVTGKAQWHLLRPMTSPDVVPPLQNNNPLLLASQAVLTQLPTTYTDMTEYTSIARNDSKDSLSSDHSSKEDLRDDQWLSQVEIITHLGPHRRLWMGPQFSFKTYQPSTVPPSHHPLSSSLLTFSDTPPVSMDVVTEETLQDNPAYSGQKPCRSMPVAMPSTRPAYRRLSGDTNSPSPSAGIHTSPLLIEACSFEQSPNICDVYWSDPARNRQRTSGEEEERLRETLADAMMESPLRDGGPTSLHHDCVEALSVSSGSNSI